MFAPRALCVSFTRLLFFLVLAYSVVQGQNVNVDSLKRLLGAHPAANRETVERWQALSAHYWNIHTDSSLYYAEQALTLATALGEDRLVGLSKYLKANVLMAKENNAAARALFQEAIEIFKAVGDKEKWMKALSNSAVSFTNENNYAEARIWYERALSIAAERKDMGAQATIYANLAILSDQEGDKQKAVTLYIQSLRYFEAKGDWGAAGKIHQNLGAVYSNLEDQHHAIEHTRQALALYERAGNLKSRNNALMNLAYYYKESDSLAQCAHYIALAESTTFTLNPVQQSLLSLLKGQLAESHGDYPAALMLLDSCVAQARIANSPINLHNGYATLARIQLAQRQYAQALKNARVALGLATQMNDAVSMNLDQKFVAKAYEGLGNTPEALHFYSAYEAGRDTLYSQETFEAVRIVEEKYESEKKEREIQAQRAQIAEQRLYLGGGSAILLFLAVLAGWLYQSRRQRQRQLTLETEKSQLLAEQNRQLEALNTDLKGALEQATEDSDPTQGMADTYISLTNRDKTRLRLGDILYVESKGNFVHIYTPEGRHLDWQQINHYEALLGASNLFVRTHRSFMANRLHITGRRATELTLSNGSKVPIASTPETKKAVHDWLDQWLNDGGHTAS